jgi:hypothetical protein
MDQIVRTKRTSVGTSKSLHCRVLEQLCLGTSILSNHEWTNYNSESEPRPMNVNVIQSQLVQYYGVFATASLDRLRRVYQLCGNGNPQTGMERGETKMLP